MDEFERLKLPHQFYWISQNCIMHLPSSFSWKRNQLKYNSIIPLTFSNSSHEKKPQLATIPFTS